MRVILLQIFNRTINATQQNSTFLGSKVEHPPITYLQYNSQQEILYNSFRRQVAETFFSADFISVATFEQTSY